MVLDEARQCIRTLTIVKNLRDDAQLRPIAANPGSCFTAGRHLRTVISPSMSIFTLLGCTGANTILIGTPKQDPLVRNSCHRWLSFFADASDMAVRRGLIQCILSSRDAPY